MRVTFRPATFSPTTIEIGFPPRFIKRQLYFTQQREKTTPIQISKKNKKLSGFLSSFILLLINKRSNFLKFLITYY